MTRLRMARVTSTSVLWQKFPAVIDTENGTVRLEARGRVETEFIGVEIVQLGQNQWAFESNDPKYGRVTISVQHGCACGGPRKTDLRGRPAP